MALTEATSRLLEYLDEIEDQITPPDAVESASDAAPDLDMGELFDQLLEHAIELELFVARGALLQTLETFRNLLKEAGAEKKISLSDLFAALKAYLQGNQVERQIRTIVSYLPPCLADQYAVILSEEASVLPLQPEETTNTATAPVSAQEDDTLMQDEVWLPNHEIGAECAENEASYSAISTINQSNETPLHANLNMAIEELHALLQTDASLPEQEALTTLVQEHLDNLEFIASASGATAFLNTLKTLQAWTVNALDQQEVNLGEFLSDLLVKLAELPFEQVDTPMPPVNSSKTELEPEPEPNESAGFSDERLAMLHEELSEFDEQLAQQALLITAEKSDGETLLECTGSYSELIGRLVSACEALGLNGLKRIGNFVIENVNVLPTLSHADRLAVRPLLTRWPEMVKHYLTDPSDDSALMGLIDLLQEQAWPIRFDGLDSRDLYMELSTGAEEEEETANEEPRKTLATVEDISLDLGPDVNTQLLDAFLFESPDVATRFNQTIADLGSAENPFDGMRSAQRLSHTLKGSANLVGLKGIATLAHHIEDIFDTLSRRQLTPSAQLIAVLSEAADCLESMIDTVAGRDSTPDNALVVLQKVLDIANLIDSGEYDPVTVLPASQNSTPPTASADAQSPSTAPAAITSVAETIRVPTATVDAMFRLVEEITISLAQVNEHVNRLKQRSESLNLHDRNLQHRRFDLENLVDVRSMAAMQKRLHGSREALQKFDSLEMDQYDELHSATHSYIEVVADAREISSALHEEILELDGFMLRQSRLNKELQQLVSATRMVPVSDIMSRLERAVRQASRATGHAAELFVDHQNLMMDGDVLNKLVDPLLHILRNAVDHGMSRNDENGETGRITVRFVQEGSNILIRIADNGKGLDYPRIREVAVERGLTLPEQEPDREELARFIMSPAFTTRSSTTQVSGRGIGMDAVFTTITELKGTISVHDVEPHGAEFVIRLPLSLVTTHSLVVRSGTDVYAIPSTTLSQILPPGSGEIQEREDGYTFYLENEMYAMRPLTTLLGGDFATSPASATILLTGRGARPTAIGVDAVLQSSDLVIKRLGRFVPKVPGIAGISVLGDGRVLPVLDLAELLISAQEGTNIVPLAAKSKRASHPLRQNDSMPTVMVVDDSLSARNSLGQLLQDTGYSVVSARDGVEAMELLQTETPFVVLADLEMPRMDGIELTRHIRSNERLQRLPVVMITSRSQKKHRQEAEAAGVSAYLTKPYMEDELIDLITNLV